ncbi:retron system putative HNH endonuclease [Desulfobacter sp.]|uniref:retron system putative HNH endonuclease n=1 Tax=Desulfobacter sp. TaxID=2294 RepID=UPI000E8F4DAD|nr:retron system putative HNH endonuclease [Desulfobacter sp.]HBT87984.1 TIGR02646 family protein [Desulfobacter sp.]
MKAIRKSQEPISLENYRLAVPASTWQQMRNDSDNDGQQAYGDCRSQTISDQKGLCAFCEIDIHDNNPLKCRVEHFHPKSDTNTPHNWGLDWQNMFAVCNGGTRPEVEDNSFHMPPIKANMSCDAYKDMMIQKGQLPVNCEGWIINPHHLPPFPSLFRVHKGTGELEPDPTGCAACPPLPSNHHQDIQKLIQHTIDMLNLNCDRLQQARLKIIHHIEKNKKKQRQNGYSSQQGLNNLAHIYFRNSWPAFFTTIRFCLGQGAETHLNSITFQG